MKNHNDFAIAFRKVRRARGLTQEGFLDESGRTYISELERGLKRPTLAKIDQLAVPLEVHPATLIALAYASNVNELNELLELVGKEAMQVLLL